VKLGLRWVAFYLATFQNGMMLAMDSISHTGYLVFPVNNVRHGSS
jgi:hypothetical protein